jgi:hypothetical protein
LGWEDNTASIGMYLVAETIFYRDGDVGYGLAAIQATIPLTGNRIPGPVLAAEFLAAREGSRVHGDSG